MKKPRPPETYFEGLQRRLARAIAEADETAVAELAVATDLARPGAQGITLLFYALSWVLWREDRARLAVLGALVRAGADAAHQVPELGSVLDVALRARGTAPLRALLDAGVAPDTRLGGTTPILFRAANEDAVEHMRLLLERGADVNARDSLANAAIVDALRSLQLDQVEELLDRGADPRVVNLLGDSFANVLEALMSRQAEGSKALAKMRELRDRIVRQGVEWPPASPLAERDRMRARGEEPIVPVGHDR
jgi:ankyrin repeat protein